MANKNSINVLIYSGPGTSALSISQAFQSLQTCLSPRYVCSTISSSALINEPWPPTCAALVVPGGADLPYCRVLNGRGNARIRAYVENGGVYLGFCAGAYYASRRCEFMQGRSGMEVVGERELGFYPGTKRGLAFDGFEYGSERGAKASRLNVSPTLVREAAGKVEDQVVSYYNGGGIFIGAASYETDGVEILATYDEQPDCESDHTKSAIVCCKVGLGSALLTGPHPEFASSLLDTKDGHQPFQNLVRELRNGEKNRLNFFRACLDKVRLDANWGEVEMASISPFYLSGRDGAVIPGILDALKPCLSKDSVNQSIILSSEAISFRIVNSPPAIIQLVSSNETENKPDMQKKNPLQLIIKTESYPEHFETPNFNHQLYFDSLNSTVLTGSKSAPIFGACLLYTDTIESTSTLIEKNPTLQQILPVGATVVASRQISGRGRGSNAWSSPRGTMSFSTLLSHPMDLSSTAPVVFIQYLASMAVVRVTRMHQKPNRWREQGDDGYAVQIKLKWPNDIYALVPSEKKENNQWVKVGGVLVTSSYTGSSFVLTVGIGLNVSNTAGPTTCLNHLCSLTSVEPFKIEILLAKILTQLENLYRQFCISGWDFRIEKEYLDMWLHSNQIVTVESEGGLRVKINGITRDWGLLLAEELCNGDRPTGYMIALQSDNNSFDFMRGLIKRKQ